MTEKSLEDKAVDIRGKKYVLVSDRVVYFNEKYPEGSITTELVSTPDAKHIVVKARISPDNGPRIFTGYSQAIIGDGMVNKTAALENAETSAVGRALAFMGIGVIDSVASVDEMQKASQTSKTAPQRTQTPETPKDLSAAQRSGIAPSDKKIIAAWCKSLGRPINPDNAQSVIKELTGLELVAESVEQIKFLLGELLDTKNDQ